MKQLISGAIIFFIAQESKAGDTITAVKAKSYSGKEVTLCDRVNYGRYLNVSKKTTYYTMGGTGLYERIFIPGISERKPTEVLIRSREENGQQKILC